MSPSLTVSNVCHQHRCHETAYSDVGYQIWSHSLLSCYETIQCPPRLPIPYVKIHIESDLSGSSFSVYSMALGFIIKTNRLNPDLNQTDFDSQIWTKLAGSQVIFHTIKSSTNPIQLRGLFEKPKNCILISFIPFYMKHVTVSQNTQSRI